MSGTKKPVPEIQRQESSNTYIKICCVADLAELVRSSKAEAITVNGIGTVGVDDVDNENNELILFTTYKQDREIHGMSGLMTVLESVPQNYQVMVSNGFMSNPNFRLHDSKPATLAQVYKSKGQTRIMLEYAKE